MNRIILKSVPAAAALACLALTGCMGYTLKPDRPLSMPKAGAPPLPLKVGLVVDDPQTAASGGFGAKFASALRQSSLFQEVRYPLLMSRGALSGVDLLITGRFKSDFIQDPLQGPKIFFVVFTGFLTGAVMTETSHHLAQGALSVTGPDGKELKVYDENVDVVAASMVSMFAEQETMKLGPPAAMDNLVAKLVQGLIDDRPLFERLGAPAPPRPAEEAKPAPQPLADAEPAPEPQPQIAAEPAPARRGPLTPAEENEIDAQVMP